MSITILGGGDTSVRRKEALPRPPKDVVISKKEIGERLRALRNAREMTQAELAEILGTRHTNVSGIERGTRGITVQQVVKLARALEVSPADILDGGSMKTRRASRPLPRRFERIQTLPRAKQRVLHELIDAFLEKHSSS